MKGYLIIDTEVKDQGAFSEFVERIASALAAGGGRFTVRNDNVEAVEGDWTPSRLVIMEFDSLDAARAFVGSDEYRSLDDLRHRAVTSKIVLVEGYAS